MENSTRQDDKTRFIVISGLMIAIATVLSYIKPFQMPQGGSITAGSMIPILIIGFRYGAKKGFLVGAIYGILQAILQGYVIHPMQFILDYPLPFGLLGLSGLFANNIYNAVKNNSSKYIYIILGTLIGIFGRFICHVLSGVIFFKEYAGAQNPWIYSIVYNSTYLIVEFIISAIILSLLWNTFEKTIFKRA
ncbi:MAG: energy-coupled thiamine transporter ThiT [Andreesenia angusta]|nr:energy-coupled thiamine transporter ThiT [Andreesenia angusta]